jgi:hypothetical protein
MMYHYLPYPRRGKTPINLNWFFGTVGKRASLRGRIERAALEYLAMTQKQKTLFYLQGNTKPNIPDDFGPLHVKKRTGVLYDMLRRKWARQQLARMV